MNAQQIYERIGTLSLEEVLPKIEEHINDWRKQKIQIKEFSVAVQSLRLRTFHQKGVQCPCCSNKGSFFAVEKTKGNSGGYHLNLYGIDQENNEILFTHDHILARGLGGADNIDNSRTMCGPCNWAKGKIEGLISQVSSDEERKELEAHLKKYLPN